MLVTSCQRAPNHEPIPANIPVTSVHACRNILPNHEAIPFRALTTSCHLCPNHCPNGLNIFTILSHACLNIFPNHWPVWENIAVIPCHNPAKNWPIEAQTPPIKSQIPCHTWEETCATVSQLAIKANPIATNAAIAAITNVIGLVKTANAPLSNHVAPAAAVDAAVWSAIDPALTTHWVACVTKDHINCALFITKSFAYSAVK